MVGGVQMTDIPFRGASAPPPAPKRSLFELYKPGQGYYTRLGTGLCGGVLVLAGGDFLWRQLEVFVDADQAWTQWMRIGVPALFVVVTGLLLYWMVCVNRGSCDFMIATEGEMKKVNWSTRRELIGSTKVVIVFTLLMGFLLFFVDTGLTLFFGWIGVLRSVPDFVRGLLGGGP